MINSKNLPRIRELIIQLNDIAIERKECTDQLWLLDERAGNVQRELLSLLNHE